MRKIRKPSPILIFAAVLLVLLPLIAYLQYSWLGRVSESDRERMQAGMRRAADEFSNDFDREIGAIFSAFNFRPPLMKGTSPDDYASSYFRWAETARHPHLIDDVFLIEKDGTGRQLKRLNPTSRRFEPAEWPPALAKLKVDAALPRPLDPDIPGVVMPILPMPFRDEPPDYLAVTLNMDSIQKEILPSLARNLSPDYSAKVIERDQPHKVIFQSGPRVSENSAGDVTANLFSLRLPDVFAAETAALPPPPPKLERRSEVFSFRVVRNVSGGKPVSAGIFMNDEPGLWQLMLTHRSGSVDAAVDQVRRRNLGISSGILLLLTGSIIMMIISTERARRLAQQQIEFASAVSHELRTPLAVICSAGENLADGVINDPERTRRYGALVRDEGRRLTEMIEQVLDFAGIRSGRKIYHLRPIDARDVVAEALDTLQLQLRELHFDVEVLVPESAASIMADKSALVRAVQNLIGNALKYSGATHWVGIRVASTPEGVSITVRDRGAGIAAHEVKHIFEPFYRGRLAVDGQIKGSGLGLSLVKEIVEAHRGTITATSVSGEGSSFQIVLPAHA